MPKYCRGGVKKRSPFRGSKNKIMKRSYRGSKKSYRGSKNKTMKRSYRGGEPVQKRSYQGSNTSSSNRIGTRKHSYRSANSTYRSGPNNPLATLNHDTFTNIVYECLKTDALPQLSAFAEKFREYDIDLQRTIEEPASFFKAKELGYIDNTNIVTDKFQREIKNPPSKYSRELREIRVQADRDVLSYQRRPGFDWSKDDSTMKTLFQLRLQPLDFIVRELESQNQSKKYQVDSIDFLSLKEHGGGLDNITLTDKNDHEYNLQIYDRILFCDLPDQWSPDATVTALYIIRNPDQIIQLKPNQQMKTSYLSDKIWW